MLSLLYLVVRALARLFVAACHDDGSKDLEILVLRHQLRVLQRKTGPPKLRVIDRPSEENAELIERAMVADTYPWVRYYGAIRAALEMAARTATPLRARLLDAVSDVVANHEAIPIRHRGLLFREVAAVAELTDGVGVWERDVIPLVGLLPRATDTDRPDAYEELIVRLSRAAATKVRARRP